MSTLSIHNWGKWQSYRSDRGQPPWIKIHRECMRNIDWVSLSDAQRGQLVAIWLLAADRNGVIPASPSIIKKLCHLDTEPDLNMFIEQGFIDAPHDGVTLASTVRQVDQPEKSREETDTDADKSKEASSASDDKKTKSVKTTTGIDTLLSLGVDEQSAKDWLTVRKAKRAPLTETALNELKSEAAKAGITVGEAVAICAKKSWQGFNANWNWKDEAVKRGTPKPENFASRDYGEGIQKL